MTPGALTLRAIVEDLSLDPDTATMTAEQAAMVAAEDNSVREARRRMGR